MRWTENKLPALWVSVHPPQNAAHWSDATDQADAAIFLQSHPANNADLHLHSGKIHYPF
jgi:hypothetical protein